MRRAVVVVSVVLSSLLFAESAFAQAKLAEVTARPESVSPGEPVRLTAKLTEPAPAGGTEVTFDVWDGGNGQHLPEYKSVVPAGATSVSQDVYLPAKFRSTTEYSFRATVNGSALNAPQRRLDPGARRDGVGARVVHRSAGERARGSVSAVHVHDQQAGAAGRADHQRRRRVQRAEDGAYVRTNGDGNGLYFPEGTRRAIFLGNTDTGTSWGWWNPSPVAMLAEIGPQQVGRPPTSRLRLDFIHLPPWFALTHTAYVKPGGSTTMAVGIGNAPNPAGTTISLSSDNPDLIVPATVFIPPGEAGVQFNVSAPAQTTTWLARMTATWGERTTLGDIYIETPGVPQVTPTPTPTPAPVPATIRPGGFPTITSGPSNKRPVERDRDVHLRVHGPSRASSRSTSSASSNATIFSLGRRRGEPCTSPMTYTGLEPGSYQFGVQGVDEFAFRGSQRTRSFTVNAPARPLPAPPVFSAPATTPTGWVVVTGTAERGARVEVFDRASPDGPRFPAPFFTAGVSIIDGRWRLSVNDLTEGKH